MGVVTGVVDGTDGADEVLAEQVEYYRARAPEYDDWWERRHEYDDGPEFARGWRADIDELRRWLDGAGPLGDVVELAAGTGNWTAELGDRATRVTAVDASPEVLRLNDEKVAARRRWRGEVEYVVADLFEWEPHRRFDTVFFGFWLSHVPAERAVTFWELVDRALAPGGVVLLCDNADPVRAAARGPARRPPALPQRQEGSAAPDRVTRALRDGSTFEIVKRYWTPQQLERELAALGWHATVGETSFAFIHATVTRASP